MKHLSKIIGISAFITTVALTLAGCSSAGATTANKEHPDWPDHIVVAQMPNENNPGTDGEHEKFSQAMEKALGIKVESFDNADYTAGVEGMANKKVDVMLVSPMSYFQAKERAGAELLVSTPTAEDYHTAFITNADRNDINKLEDLKGKSFAFVDQASSSGYLYPKAYLVKKLGLDPDKLESSNYFFSTVAFSGNHTTSAKGVEMGDYDAAAVAASVMTQMEKAGQLDKSKIKVIDKTDTIPNPAYVVRKDLPSDLKDKLKQFFLSYDDPEYFETVHGSKDIRFVPVTEDDYKSSKELLDLLHIDLGNK